MQLYQLFFIFINKENCLKFLKKILLLIILFQANKLSAQNSSLGSWDIVNLFIKPTDKYFIYAETQTRSQKLTTDFYYHEFKAGAGLNFAKKHSVFVGLGDYTTYTFPGNYKSPITTKEFRLWEQLILNNNIDRVKIEHRYRIEQRWVNGDFQNRFRYRFNPIIPINHSSIKANTLFATAFDEVFFTNLAPYFIRNRFFAGAGYQFTHLFAFQAGWIRQFDYRISDDGSGKNFIQTTLLFTVDKSKKNPVEKLPSTMD